MPKKTMSGQTAQKPQRAKTTREVEHGILLPEEWIVYAPLADDYDARKPGEWGIPEGVLGGWAPEHIGWQGRRIHPRRMRPQSCQLDLGELLPPPMARDGKRLQSAAWILLPVVAAGPRAGVEFGFGGCGYFQVWFNGRQIDPLPGKQPLWPPSPRDHVLAVDLRQGINWFAVRLIGGAGNIGGNASLLAFCGPRTLAGEVPTSILSEPFASDPRWAAAPVAAPGGKTAVDIGSRREVFFDDFLLDGTAGPVRRRLGQPVPREIVLAQDRPWEGVHAAIYSCMIQDGNRVRMYYRGSPRAGAGDHSPEQYTCLAESSDGIHFTRPELGLVGFEGSKRNNILLAGVHAHNFTPFLDARPDEPEATRYKALAYHPQATPGLFAFASPDGVRWELLSQEPVLTSGSFDSQNLAFWDPHRGKYMCYFRDNSTGLRRVMRALSEDFLHWSPAAPLRYADSRQEQFYTNGILPYPRAPHLLVGLPSRFVPERTKFPAHGNNGISDGVFMSSRDGLCFERWERGFIRPAAEPEVWTDRNNYPAWGMVESDPGTLSVYWNEHYRHPGNRLRRGTLRADGFVSLSEAGDAVGEAITRPLRFVGDTLFVNFATSAAGSLRFELCDPNGRAIPGFSLGESEVLFGNELGHAVGWSGGAIPARVARGPVRLRIRMFDADLYAIQFGTLQAA